MQDSNIALLPGAGIAGNKRLAQLVKDWGKLPEKERAQAMQQVMQNLPPRHRQLIEDYLKKISESKKD